MSRRPGVVRRHLCAKGSWADATASSPGAGGCRFAQGQWQREAGSHRQHPEMDFVRRTQVPGMPPASYIDFKSLLNTFT